MDSAPTAAVTPESHSMADEAESSAAAAASCASALAAFVTNGRALLQLAEMESRQGRQARLSVATGQQQQQTELQCPVIYLPAAAGGPSIIRHRENEPRRTPPDVLASFLRSGPHRISRRVRQPENSHRARAVTAGSDPVRRAALHTVVRRSPRQPTTTVTAVVS